MPCCFYWSLSGRIQQCWVLPYFLIWKGKQRQSNYASDTWDSAGHTQILITAGDEYIKALIEPLQCESTGINIDFLDSLDTTIAMPSPPFNGYAPTTILQHWLIQAPLGNIEWIITAERIIRCYEGGDYMWMHDNRRLQEQRNYLLRGLIGFLYIVKPQCSNCWFLW